MLHAWNVLVQHGCWSLLHGLGPNKLVEFAQGSYLISVWWQHVVVTLILNFVSLLKERSSYFALNIRVVNTERLMLQLSAGCVHTECTWHAQSCLDATFTVVVLMCGQVSEKVIWTKGEAAGVYFTVGAELLFYLFNCLLNIDIFRKVSRFESHLIFCGIEFLSYCRWRRRVDD